jgi:ribosomal protein S18 acetylase RimI-like enzyme
VTGALFVYCLNKASEAELVTHLSVCDSGFVPTLSSRVKIRDYAKKLAGHAVRFEAWLGEELIGLVAAYCNDSSSLTAYISNVSVVGTCTGQGVACELLHRCVVYARTLNMEQIELEVGSDNFKAINLYTQVGFIPVGEGLPFVVMSLKLTE